MRQIGEGESWYSQVPDPTKRKIITISFSPRSKGSEHHIKIPSLGVLCREDEHPEHLTWKASRAYIRETQRTMRNRDFTLKEHKQNLTCSKIQGRNSNLKEARITLRPKPGWFLFLSAKKEKGRKLEANTLMNIDAKILNTILANQIQQYTESITHLWCSGICPRDARLIQQSQIYQCDTWH